MLDAYTIQRMLQYKNRGEPRSQTSQLPPLTSSTSLHPQHSQSTSESHPQPHPTTTMKSFIALSLAALTMAAPAALEKRIAASITLYDGKNYGGASFKQSFNIQEPTCVSPTLPASIDNKASSIRLEGDLSHFNCRLYA